MNFKLNEADVSISNPSYFNINILSKWSNKTGYIRRQLLYYLKLRSYLTDLWGLHILIKTELYNISCIHLILNQNVQRDKNSEQEWAILLFF